MKNRPRILRIARSTKFPGGLPVRYLTFLSKQSLHCDMSIPIARAPAPKRHIDARPRLSLHHFQLVWIHLCMSALPTAQHITVVIEYTAAKRRNLMIARCCMVGAHVPSGAYW